MFKTRWKTQQDEKEVDTRFKQRVGDIAFWKSELEGKLADLKREIEAVECKHIRIAAGLGATSEPLTIAEKCFAHRAQRVGVDRCDDNVNKHLQVKSKFGNMNNNMSQTISFEILQNITLRTFYLYSARSGNDKGGSRVLESRPTICG